MNGLSSFINRYNLVKQIPVFNKLSWYDQQKIARKAVLKEYKKGETIYHQGNPPDYFYCLVSGRLQAYRINKNGLKDNVEFIHRGKHFGIISLLTGENHSLTFEAINDSVVLQIHKDDFQTLLQSMPVLGIEFSQILSQRIRQSNVQAEKSIFESTIISIYSPVQGTGSSTYAMNLALALGKETKKKVIWLSIYSAKGDVNKKESAERIVTGPTWEKPPLELKDIVGDHDKIFDGIIKDELPVDLLFVVIDLKDPSITKQISPLVSTLVRDYHYVIVDLPNDMDDVVLETLTQSDAIHLVSRDERRDLTQTRKVIDRLETTLKGRFREEKIHIILRPARDKMFLSFDEINKQIDFRVSAMLPNIAPEHLKEPIHLKHITIRQCVEQSDYGQAVRRIARKISGVRVGIVLGGGAALGVAHVGVIRVLEEENIPVDVVAGSSMGALIASIWSLGKSAKELEAVAREFANRTDMWKLFAPANPFKALIGGSAIVHWLKRHLGDNSFHATKFPLKIVSYDLIRRQENIITEGLLVDAVRESIAIPGILPPVCRGEQVIIDGGVLNPLPTNVLAAEGINKIIAVNVLQSPGQASESYDLARSKLQAVKDVPFSQSPLLFLKVRLMRQVVKIFTPSIPDIIVRTLQATEYVIAEQSAQQADVLIQPNLVGINWFELYHVDELIKRGEEAAREALPAIKRLIE